MFRKRQIVLHSIQLICGIYIPGGCGAPVLWLVDIYGAIGSSAGFFVTME